MAILTCLLAVYDGHVTESRIKKYGLGVELNPFIKWLIAKLGVEIGVSLGIMVPTLTLASFFVAFNLTTLMGVFLGIRIIVARYQWISLQLEVEFDRILAEQAATKRLAEETVRSAATASTSKPLDDSTSVEPR